MARQATRFDSMNFEPYEFREYPKMVSLPRKLPQGMPDPANLEEGCKRFDANGNLIAVVKDGAWEPIPMQVPANSEEEEQSIVARHSKGQPLRVEAEKEELMRQCVTRGLQFDKRWGVDRLKKLLNPEAA